MNYSLSLTGYSAKYGVSVSTLRRKIKKDQVLYKQESGKYMLPDVSYEDLQNKISIASPQEVTNQEEIVIASPHQSSSYETDLDLGLDVQFQEEDGSSLAPLTNLSLDQEEEVEPRSMDIQIALDHLRSSYTQILSEKDAQINSLRAHIADLQTLNKALESEVKRLEALDADALGLDFGSTTFLKEDL